MSRILRIQITTTQMPPPPGSLLRLSVQDPPSSDHLSRQPSSHSILYSQEPAGITSLLGRQALGGTRIMSYLLESMF